MMQKRQQTLTWLIGLAPFLIAEPVWAVEPLTEATELKKAPLLSELDAPARTIDEWLAQAIAQINDVRLDSTDAGLEIVLEVAEGQQLTFTRTVVDNAIVIDIPNAVLSLPEGNEFQAEAPTEDIASVSVANLPDNQVRLTITGIDAPPEVDLIATAQGLAFGVTPGTETAQSPEAEPEAELEEEEIVVTGEEETGYRVPAASVGTRTDTPIQNVPQAIQVIPKQVLEDQQILRLEDALRNATGATQGTQSSRSVFNTVIIRGFDTRNILRNGLRDDTNVTVGSELTNIERIEVLRGPASVLYGRGGIGGTINLVTEQPLSEPFYEVEAGIGSFDSYRGALDLTGPLNRDRTLRYRLNASILQADTFVDFTEIERYFVAPSLSWQIGRNTDLTIDAEFLQFEQPNDQGLPAFGTVRSNPNGELPLDRLVGEPDLTPRERRVIRAGYSLEHRFNENWRIRNAFRGSFQNLLDETFVLSRTLRPDRRTLERRITEVVKAAKESYIFDTNVVGNFNTGSVRHQVVVGFDLFRENDSGIFNLRSIAPLDIFNPVYGAPIGNITGSFDDITTTDALGIYVQDQISLADNLDIVLGGRFDLVEQRFRDFVDDSNNTTEQEDAFSPRIGIVYRPIEPISLYASFSQAFQPVSGLDFNRQPFQPERGTQYEIGIKADLNRRLFTTLALYELTRTNVLTPDLDNSGFNIQSGEQRSRGIEFDITGEILPGWNIIATYAYTDAEVTEDNRFEEGNRLANVSKHAASVWTTYEIQSGDLRGLGFGLGLFFVGEREGDLANTFTLPGYVRTDAALFYRRGNFRAALNFKNLFDIEYFETSSGPLNVFPGDPLTVSLNVSWEFR
jgi:iron complex outermembrane recepter protein